MRIVYLHQYFLTPEMSGTVRSYQMARRLVARGHEVHMVTADQQASSSGTHWRQTCEDGIHVHWANVPYDNTMSYSGRIRSFFTFAWRAAHKAAQLQGDVIFATSTPLTIALPAVYASWRCRRPMVFEVRDLWPAVPIAIGAIRNPLLQAAARWLERFAYRNSEHVVALAPGMRDEIVASGYPAEKVSVIPNGCDFDLFCDAAAAQALRERHAWLGSRPLLAYTGTFTLLTGTTYLARLAAAIAAIDPEVRIVGVGAGRDFEATTELAAQLGVLNKNLYLLGKRPKREAAAWIQAADLSLALFTGPKIVWRDAVQNKFFDSLAAGKPVVNNFPGWQAQIARDAGAGLIVSASDYDAAAREVVGALRDRAWLESAGAAAMRLARTNFDRDRLAADLAAVLDSVYDRSRQRT